MTITTKFNNILSICDVIQKVLKSSSAHLFLPRKFSIDYLEVLESSSKSRDFQANIFYFLKFGSMKT